MDSGDDRYSTASVGRDWALIPGPASALIDNQVKIEARLVTATQGRPHGIK